MAGQRFGTLTVTSARRGKSWVCVCDCGRTRDVRRRELLRYGDRNSCGDTRAHRRADVVAYGTAHDRIERDRGRAQDHQCVDCGLRAAHWSYDHADPDELVSPEGYPYSLDVERYEPRCNACHAVFDDARGRPQTFVEARVKAAAEQWEHGTRRGYRQKRCRCDACRAWNTKTQSAYAAGYRARTGVSLRTKYRRSAIAPID